MARSAPKRSIPPDASELAFISHAGWISVAKIPGLKNVYLEAFRRERDRDFGALDRRIESGDDELQAGRSRIRGACSIIGAFAAWYSVARAIAFAGPVVSAAVGTLVGVIFVVQASTHIDGRELVLAAILSLTSVTTIYIIARALRFNRAQRLFFAVAAVLLLGVAWSWIRQVHLVWLLPLWATAVASSIVLLLCFSTAIAIVRWTTSKKTTLYPDDEVLQSLLATIVSVSNDTAWARAATRRPLSAALEWIARRLERELVTMFAGPGGTLDGSVKSAGEQRAAAVRKWKNDVAFPQADTKSRLQAFLTGELANGSMGRWADLAQAEVVPTEARRNLVDFLITVGRALLPIAIAAVLGFAVVRLYSGAESVVEKALLIAGVWSFLNLLRALDPQGFDAQLEAAKSLKDVVQ
jgi:hypothetical protein